MQIRLTLPHTHAGRDYPPGSVLDLDADAAGWLIAIGAAEAHPLPVTAVVPGLVPLQSLSAPDRARKPPRSKP